MSGIDKIKANVDINIESLNKLNNASMGPISNKYYEKTQGLKKALQNSIDIDTVDILIDTLNVPKEVALNAVKLDLNEVDALTVSYQNEKRKEIDEYKKMLELVKIDLDFLEDNRLKLQEYEDSYLNLKNSTESRIQEILIGYQTFCSEEKLRELGLTQSELTNMDYLELLLLCKEKDADIKVLYQGIESYEHDVLDVQVKELIGMNYQEYKDKLASLKSDQALLLSAIRTTEEEMKIARYRFLLNEEDYKNYSYEEVKVGTEEFANASPLEKMRASGALGYTVVDAEIYEKLTNLLNASESNPDLAKMYNYLYEKEGEESAKKYLVDMESVINQTYGEAKAKEFLEHLEEEENPVDTINNHLKTTGKGLVSGMEIFSEGLTSWLTSSDVYSVNDYESMYILEVLQSNENYNFLLDNNFEISQSIGNMIPSIVLSAAFTPMVGTASMGVSAGGNSYHSAMVEGYSKDKAVIYGVLSGASEALLERYLGAIPGLSDVNVTNLKTFVQAMLKEGVEEGTQEYVDAFMRAGIFKEEFLLEEVTKNASKSAIYGAITGGIMNSPSLIVNGLNKTATSEVNNNVDSIFSESTKDNVEASDDSVLHIQTENQNILKTEINKFNNESKSQIENNSIDTVEKSEDVEITQKLNQGIEVTEKLNDSDTTLKLDNIETTEKIYDTTEKLYNVSPFPPDYNTLYAIKEDKIKVSKIKQSIKDLKNKELTQRLRDLAQNSRKISSKLDAFFSLYSIAGTYGVDQAGLNNLYYYEDSKGSHLIEKQAGKVSGDALIKFGTQQYFYLKEKLTNMGYSKRDASVILSGINNTGACSYASVASEIFSTFRDNPSSFHEYFGFSMYYTDEIGNMNLNESELLLDLYLYANDVQNGGSLFQDHHVISFDAFKGDLFDRPILNADKQIYMSTSNGINDSILKPYLNSKGLDFTSSTTLVKNQFISDEAMQNIANQIQKDIRENTTQYSLGIYKGKQEIRMIPLGNAPYVTTNTWGEGEGRHAVTVTSVTNDGFVVSSWGERYLIPYIDLQNKGEFSIRELKIFPLQKEEKVSR